MIPFSCSCMMVAIAFWTGSWSALFDAMDFVAMPFPPLCLGFMLRKTGEEIPGLRSFGNGFCLKAKSMTLLNCERRGLMFRDEGSGLNQAL